MPTTACTLMASTPVIDPRPRGGAGALLARGFRALVDRGPLVPAPFAPLVIVAVDRSPASACLAAFLDTTAEEMAVDRIAIWDGRRLGRFLAAPGGAGLEAMMTRHRLVVIDHVDEVGGPDRQRSLASLLDAVHASGTATCVSLAEHPAVSATLEPHLASRLMSGLLVQLPDAPVAMRVRHARTPSLARVFATVARHQECTVSDVLGASRCRRIAAARSLAMYVARVVTAKSFHAIGAACGGRDHTTALHAVKVVTRRLARDAACAGDVSRLVQRLSGPASQASPPLRCLFTVDSGGDCPRAGIRRSRRRPTHRQQATTRRRTVAR